MVRRSLAQNEVLFCSSSSLKLVSLDRFYTFGAALHEYARTGLAGRLEDAVDELRRLVLGMNNGQSSVDRLFEEACRRLDSDKSDVDGAWGDVKDMYVRAYGSCGKGVQVDDGLFERRFERRKVEVEEWPLKNNINEEEEETRKRYGVLDWQQEQVQDDNDDEVEDHHMIRISMLVPRRETGTPVLDPLNQRDCLVSGVADEEDSVEQTGEGLDAIEAWYRDVQIGVGSIDLGAVSSSPAAVKPQAVEERNEEEEQLQILRRTTPKISAPPPGKGIALRLQTTFDSPSLLKPKAVKPQQQTGTSPNKEEDEGEEELTARPKSAIAIPIQFQWGGASPPSSGSGVSPGSGASMLINNLSLSIDELLSDDVLAENSLLGRRRSRQRSSGGSCRFLGGDLSPQQQHQHVGPLTPNGYDDISPITRGEWGISWLGTRVGGLLLLRLVK